MKEDLSPRDSETSTESSSEEALPRKSWKAPRLRRWGDVRDLTLGGSPGGGDSGNIFVEQPFN